jgi:hypothetical protein
MHAVLCYLGTVMMVPISVQSCTFQLKIVGSPYCLFRLLMHPMEKINK